MDYEAILNLRNTMKSFPRDLGMRVTHLEEGYARMEVTASEVFQNPGGTIHGGIFFTLADTAGGVAAWSYGYFVTTIDMHIQFMRKAEPGDLLIAEGKVTKRGSRVHFVEVEITNGEGLVLCKALGSFATLDRQVIEGDISPR